MTVIACKDGWMAGDTATWTSGVWMTLPTKLCRLDDGSIVGMAGWQPEMEAALSWYKNGADPDHRPPAPTDKDAAAELLILRPDRSLWYIADHCRLWRTAQSIAAIGSHHEFLMAAMLAGLSARAAVELAVKHCQNARGDVMAMHIDER